MNDSYPTNHATANGLLGRQPTLLLTAAGVLSIALSLGWSSWATDGIARWWHAYLINVCFFLSISLGALFFVILHHLTGATWSIVLRRLSELLAMAIPLLGLLMLPIGIALILGNAQLYPWNNSQIQLSDPLIQKKTAYLNATFFVVRSVIYFVVWSLLAWFFWRFSVRQDVGDQLESRQRVRRWSGPAMFAWAITVNFAAFDWLMTLEPHWFSSIFGVYFFSGCMVGFFATIPVALAIGRRTGRIAKQVTTEHEHDVAKLLFGFVMFWAYIAFSQYMLIWYANIPEETFWFALRQQRPWLWISLLLIVGHFFLPFFGLMSRSSRRNRQVLLGWSCFLLLFHWVDLYWLVMPQYSPDRLSLGLTELLCFVGVGLLFAAAVLRTATEKQLIPVGDAELPNSIAFHNV